MNSFSREDIVLLIESVSGSMWESVKVARKTGFNPTEEVEKHQAVLLKLYHLKQETKHED